ncbi:MAG: TPM domain-containing protein [Dokdonella sp.]
MSLIKRGFAFAAVLTAAGLMLAAQARWHFASVDPLLFSFAIVIVLLYIGGTRFRALPITVHLFVWAIFACIAMLILGAPLWMATGLPLVVLLLVLRNEWENMVHGGRTPKSTLRNDGEARVSVSLADTHQEAAKPATTKGQTLLRVLRHSLIAPWRARSWHSDSLQTAIRDRIADSERGHLGEIVVAIETRWSTDAIRLDMTPTQNARNRFSELGVWNTEQNNGVLIHITLAENAIDLIADRGIAECVDASTWAAIAEELAARCKRGEIQSGLLAAIDRVGDILNQHFPASAMDENPDERSNAAVLT